MRDGETIDAYRIRIGEALKKEAFRIAMEPLEELLATLDADKDRAWRTIVRQDLAEVESLETTATEDAQ